MPRAPEEDAPAPARVNDPDRLPRACTVENETSLMNAHHARPAVQAIAGM